MLHRYVLLLILLVASTVEAFAQNVGGLRGQVLDPSGAIVPGASVALSAGKNVYTTKSGQDGVVYLSGDSFGTFTSLTVAADGFAPLTRNNVAIAAGQTRQMDVSIKIAEQQQDVTVTERPMASA